MQNEEKKIKKSFFNGMKAELKKVIWPTGKQTVKSTAVTIAFVILISAVLIILNLFFNFVSEKWYDIVLNRNEVTAESVQEVSGDESGESNVEILEESGEIIENAETENE